MGKRKSGGFFGGLFDFNGDGKTDLGERWLAHKIFEEIAKEQEGEKEQLADWRIFCRDGSKYGLDPFDFPSEALYNRALEKAEQEERERQKYAWRETCNDNDYDIDPEEFETEEEYEEAIEERELNWADYLSKEVLEQAEKLGLDPDDYSDEEEFLEHLNQSTKNVQRIIVRQKSVAQPNSVLAKSLSTGRKTSVISALRKGFPDANLSLGMRISMDPQDGAGAKCVYILESIENQEGKWVLAYTSDDAAKKDGRDGLLTGSQEICLRSIVRIQGIAGVLFRSQTKSFYLDKQAIKELLEEIPIRKTAWDAICISRTIAVEDKRK